MKIYLPIILFLGLTMTLAVSTKAQASGPSEPTNLQTTSYSSSLTSSTMTTPDGLYQYVVNDNEITITKYLGSEASVVIPEQIDGMTVTTIGEFAFSQNIILKNINLSYVKTIEQFAFNGCTNLMGVSGSYVTTLHTAAFQSCFSLQTVNMTNMLTLGNASFFNCSNLVSISMPKITVLPSSAFGNCYNLTTIDMPNVTVLGSAVFQSCRALKSINMENITRIEYGAFSWSGIVSVDLKYVTFIGDQAFYGCQSLQSVNLPAATYVDIIAFQDTSIKTVSLPNVDTVNYRAFYNASIENLTLSNHIMPPIASDSVFTYAKIKNLTINYGTESISEVKLQDFDQYVSQLGLDPTTITGKFVENNIWYKDLTNPDTIAPTITLVGDRVVTIIQSTPYVDLGATVVDNSGQPINLIIDNPVDINKPGIYTITYSATDISGNYAKIERTIQVVPKYEYSGILQPIEKDGSSVFKANSTIPVKFQLKDTNGQFISTVTATLTYQKISNNVEGQVNEAISTSAATTGNTFRFDTASNQYIFNFKTKGLSAGQYKLIITLDDGQVFDDTKITLK